MSDQGSLWSSTESPSIGEVELYALRNGDHLLVGADEAGRGPLAGPVHAAAVGIQFEPSPSLDSESVLKAGPDWLDRLDDSKKLSDVEREDLFEKISESTFPSCICSCDSAEIDSINILQASLKSMAKAVDKVCTEFAERPDRVFIDGNQRINVEYPQTPVVSGDARSLVIAAASILAKVSRDRLMERYHDDWPVYQFASNKGYPTAEHREALSQYGPSPIHRKSFGSVSELQADQSNLSIDS